MAYELNRFTKAQEKDYKTALNEIKSGRKKTHWIWYIFPQIHGLGQTETSRFYAIKSLAEAQAYLSHPVLGSRLIEISTVLLGLKAAGATEVLGTPDDLKVRSCMTLFSLLPETNDVFQKVLDKFYGGKKDQKTIDIVT